MDNDRRSLFFICDQNIILKKPTKAFAKCEFPAIVLNVKIDSFRYYWSITTKQ